MIYNHIVGTKKECYKQAEKTSLKVLKIVTSVFSSSMIFTCLSLFQTCYRVFIQNKSLEENFVLPQVSLMPFKVNNWLRYAYAFLWVYFAFLALVIMKIFTTIVLYTLCFYTIAVTQHMQFEVKRLNETR